MVDFISRHWTHQNNWNHSYFIVAFSLPVGIPLVELLPVRAVLFFWFFFALCIDLLTDKVQPLSRCVHCFGGNNVLGSVSGQEWVADGGKVVFVVHVGGTRCVTWSIDRIVQRHAWITWGVELIPRHFCHLFLVCLTDMTTTIARFFQCLTLPGA